jgi:hypothetical protein
MANITEDIHGALQGIIPSTFVTCSRDGTPNVSYISQVHYVDDEHVALSHQFFNKSVRNFYENPFAAALVVHPETAQQWRFYLRYSHSETDSELFEQMSAQLEAIATMMGMEDVFHLKAAEVFEILSVEEVK